MDKIENAPQPSHDTLLVTPAPPALPPEHISAPQPKKSHKLLVVILIVVILCIIAAVVAVVLIQKNTASETTSWMIASIGL